MNSRFKKGLKDYKKVYSWKMNDKNIKSKDKDKDKKTNQKN